MKTVFVRASMTVALAVVTAGLASAQTVVTLPNSTQTTTLTANVSEQAQVAVPVGVTFNVQDVSLNTAASSASVTVNSIVLATATKQLKISVKANAAAFVHSQVGATTWAASDVSWNAATFSNSGVGSTGALSTSTSTYTVLATCAADAASCSASDLVFTLAANSAVRRAGSHTLGMTWKFEAIGT